MQCKQMAMLLTLATLCAAGCAKSDRRGSARFARDRKAMPVDQWPAASHSAVKNVKDVEPPKILPATHLAAAKLFESQGLYGKAIHQYRKAIAVNHHYPEAHNRLGLLLSMAGSRAEALAAFRKAVELKPKDATLRNNLGFELLLAKQWAAAEYEFSEAIQIRPDFPRAFINLGIAQSKLGKFHDALASFRTVLPEADAHYNIGLMYRSQKRYAEAAGAFRRVLALDSDFTAAEKQLAELVPAYDSLVHDDERTALVRPSIAEEELGPATYRGHGAHDGRSAMASAVMSDRRNQSDRNQRREEIRDPTYQAVARRDAASIQPWDTRIRDRSSARSRDTRSTVDRSGYSNRTLSRRRSVSADDAVISILENEFGCVEEQFLDSDAMRHAAHASNIAPDSSSADPISIALALASPYPTDGRVGVLDATSETQASSPAEWVEMSCPADAPMADACIADDVSISGLDSADARPFDWRRLLSELEARLGDETSPVGPPVLASSPNRNRRRALAQIDRPPGGHQAGQTTRWGEESDRRSAIRTVGQDRDHRSHAPQKRRAEELSPKTNDRRSTPAKRTIGSRWMLDQTDGLFGLTLEALARWQLALAGPWSQDAGVLVRRPRAWPVAVFDVDAGLFPDPVFGIEDGAPYDYTIARRSDAWPSRSTDIHADMRGAAVYARDFDPDQP